MAYSETPPKSIWFSWGKKGEPIPVSQSEIDSILNQMKDGLEKPKPSVSLKLVNRLGYQMDLFPPLMEWLRKLMKKKQG